MNDEDFILLLQVIKKKGNIENLRKQGYQYSQIAQIINYVLEKGYVLYSNQGLLLSEDGEEILTLFNKKLNRKKSESFISPQKEYLLSTKKSIFDIYLPNNIRNLK